MRTKTIVISFALAAVSWAQTTLRSSSIIAVGSATVSATPDVARVDVGVSTQAATAQAATAANATQAGAVIAALQAIIGSGTNIKTISYSLSPVYNNPAAGQTATIIGYAVTNELEVTVTDLSQIGKVIDTAIQSGANRVQGITFDLRDRNPATAQALKLAAANSRTQADAIAAGLNVHTGIVLHATQGVNTTTPFLGAGVAASTPIETGLVVVQASVTLEVAILP
jgi:uncharacterized protein YggE